MTHLPPPSTGLRIFIGATHQPAPHGCAPDLIRTEALLRPSCLSKGAAKRRQFSAPIQITLGRLWSFTTRSLAMAIWKGGQESSTYARSPSAAQRALEFAPTLHLRWGANADSRVAVGWPFGGWALDWTRGGFPQDTTPISERYYMASVIRQILERHAPGNGGN